MHVLNLKDTCQPLIDFLIFSTIDNNAGAAPNTVQDHAGVTFHNPVQVSRVRQHTILYTQLPSLKPTPNGRDPELHRLLNVMHGVRVGLLGDLTDCQINRTKRKAVKGIKQRWNDKTVDRIFKMWVRREPKQRSPTFVP